MRERLVFIFMIVCSLLSGCQQESHPSYPKERQDHKTSSIQSPCTYLRQDIQHIDNRSTVEALKEVNFRLKQCLPQFSMNDRTLLIYATTAMYQRFLFVDRTPDQQQYFEQYAINTSSYPTLQQSYESRFSKRDQYLIEHQSNAAYYELYDAGNNLTKYRRQPDYLKDIFAPFLPAAEQMFIINLAKQNRQPVISNNTFNLTWQEIADRAQFWESYTISYPNSIFFEDAQRLKFAYTRFLFHGLPNMPISTNYEGEENIHPEALQEIKGLAANGHSQLSERAVKFLKFIEIPIATRDAKFPIELSPVEQRSKRAEIIKDMKQLDQYIGLYDPLSFDSTHINRDCFSDSICVTHLGNISSSFATKQEF
ncbi:hypothetical protein I2F29_04930 [Acinetobacter sp. FNA3]|nr:hypothetical protein [Acinetobacter pollinis]MBF7692747.1 hypothetical protein [Acinetobacter pollinis]MBF7697784.1 hypothetical protein [Acinetobacter pollinis]MBF7700774.1 hypothetical protein [Acinetobacter pollinis]